MKFLSVVYFIYFTDHSMITCNAPCKHQNYKTSTSNYYFINYNFLPAFLEELELNINYIENDDPNNMLYNFITIYNVLFTKYASTQKSCKEVDIPWINNHYLKLIKLGKNTIKNIEKAMTLNFTHSTKFLEIVQITI